MGYTIATTNMKGGVGKTTLTVNLATCLVKHHRKRVLVVDLDPQISATLSLMPPKTFAKLRKAQRTLKFLLQDAIKSNFKHDVGIQEIIQPYAGSLLGIDVLPGDIDLYNDFLVAETLYRKALRNPDRNFDRVWADFEAQLMSGILKPIIDDYDFIFLDCAPSYNLLTRSSLVASDFYLIPAKPEPLSYIGMQLLERQLTKLIETHKDDGYMKAQLIGIVFTMSKNLLSGRYYNEIIKRVRNDFNDAQLFKTTIPVDINVSKAVDSFRPVVLDSPNSSGAKAFANLASEFLKKLSDLQGKDTPQNKFKLSKLD